ncbi:hypothetical protein FDUTEX481_09977 [Tolypothrix sp. PCC 7601]|nr:hypothetical protein FDUTEX481_09977 [Tolypothrix sp. PCC 7601]
MSFVIGHWSFVIGHWSFVIGSWVFVISPCPQSPLPLIPRGGPEFPSPQSPTPSPHFELL